MYVLADEKTSANLSNWQVGQEFTEKVNIWYEIEM